MNTNNTPQGPKAVECACDTSKPSEPALSGKFPSAEGWMAKPDGVVVPTYRELKVKPPITPISQITKCKTVSAKSQLYVICPPKSVGWLLQIHVVGRWRRLSPLHGLRGDESGQSRVVPKTFRIPLVFHGSIPWRRPTSCRRQLPQNQGFRVCEDYGTTPKSISHVPGPFGRPRTWP